MRVYWNADGKEDKGLPGRRQRVKLSFFYAGKRRFIPAVYRFPQGIAFDVVTILDEPELRAYHDEYVNASTSAQRLAVMDPYQSIPFVKFIINDEPVSGGSGSCMYHIPSDENYKPLTEEAKAYKRHLDGAPCFVRERHMLTTSAIPASKWEQLRRWLFPKRINRLEFEIAKATRFLPIELSFELPRDFSDVHTETFAHPNTHVTHTLCFQNINHEEVNIPAGKGNRTLHITKLSYEIDPALPEGDQLQFDNSIVLEPDYRETEAGARKSASSIGIIGRSHGPTAIFVPDSAGPGATCGVHGLALHTCLAKPSTDKDDIVNVVLEGVHVNWLDTQTVLWERD